MREMVVKQLASTSGLQRWVDYIPMKLATSTRPAGEQTTDADGFIAINSLQDTSSGVAFKDWVPVYFDSDATDAWVVSDSGYIPVGASGGAIAILQSFGSDAHVYLPGSSGVSLSGLLTNNYTDSTGSTGYSANDGVAGLALDGMGSVGANVVVNGDFATDTIWSKGPQTTISGGKATIASTGAASSLAQTGVLSATSLYIATFDAVVRSGTGKLENSVGGTYLLIDSTKSYSCIFTGSASIVFNRLSACDIDIDNVVFREVSGIHATQTTTANNTAVRRRVYNELLNSATQATQNVT